MPLAPPSAVQMASSPSFATTFATCLSTKSHGVGDNQLCDSKSDIFSEPGDSGSIVADIRGRVGGMLTGVLVRPNPSDMTYATPFWWLLKRIQASGLPTPTSKSSPRHLDINEDCCLGLSLFSVSSSRTYR